MKPAVLLLVGALPLLAQEGEKTAVVEGLVVNSVTGAGIPEVTVKLSSRPIIHNYSAVTDAKGSFRLEDVKPGDYTPTLTKSGFVPAQSDSFDDGAPIHVRAGSDPVRTTLELMPPSTLRGRVIGIDGNPAAHVEVLLGPRYTATARTDEDGGFVFENVESGQHSLAAQGEPVPTYFPSATDPALAEPIQVLSGADQGGYEIRLRAATVHRVRGVVLDAEGRPPSLPAPMAVLSLVPGLSGHGPPGFTFTSNGTTSFPTGVQPMGVQPIPAKPAVAGDDGAFEFSAVPDGDWVLRAQADKLHRSSAEISVQRDVDDVRIRAMPLFELHGRVTMSEDSQSPVTPLVTVNLVSADRLPAGIGIAAKGGVLRIGNVAEGRYRIQAAVIGGSYYVSSVMVGDVDAARQPAPLNPASPEIQVLIKRGGTISGSVEKGEGAVEKGEGARVLLIPQSLAPGDIGKLQWDGADGSFNFTGLPPGEYYAIALNGFEVKTMSGLERMREIVRDATPVYLEDGGAASIQLKAPIKLK